MTAEQLFSVCNLVALCGWVLLIFAPRWSRVKTIVGCVIPVMLSVTYFILLVTHIRDFSGGGFGTLAEVSALFANGWVLLAGWVHYLAFDLFVGNWIAGDARERGIAHLLVIPCLLLTFLFGPIGFLLYMAIRSLRRGTPEPAKI